MPVASGGIGTVWTTGHHPQDPNVTLILVPRGLGGSPCEMGRIRAKGASSIDDYFCGAYAPRGGRARLTPSLVMNREYIA
jgi:hypothetical protein